MRKYKQDDTAMPGIERSKQDKEVKCRLDYLESCCEEIDHLHNPGEEKFSKKEDRPRHGEVNSRAEAFVGLSESDGRFIPAYDLLSRAVEKIQDIAQIDSEAEEMAQTMKDILFRLEDVVEKLRSYLEQLNFDPDYAREVEERFFALRDLMRKYGESLTQVCAFREEAAAKWKNCKVQLSKRKFWRKSTKNPTGV